MGSEIAHGAEARKNMITALDFIAQCVGSTMGPGGMSFGFDKFGTDMRLTATWSKDGLTALRALRFDSPVGDAVLQYCKQTASHSVMASGDGSTSTIILANAVAKAVNECNEKWPQAFARRLEEDANDAIDAIRREAIRGTDVTRKVALTSTNGDEELTDVVIEAINYSSAFGSILVEKNPASAVRYKIDRQDGYSNCKGYDYNSTFALSASPNAAAKKPLEWEQPHVVIFNGNLILKAQLDPILKAWSELLVQGMTGSLLIVAYEVSDEVINQLLVLNRKVASQGVATFVIKPRLTAEENSGIQIIRDIASFCGIKEDNIIDGGNYTEVKSGFFGSPKKVKIMPGKTMFLGRASNHWVDHRIMQNQGVIDGARSQFDREITTVRNSELAEGLVKVEVGGGLLPDLQERADRFDDASKAAQACMVNGALPGCGCSYIRAAVLAGVHHSLERAFRSIYETVLMNFGKDPNMGFVPAKGMGAMVIENNVELGNAEEMGILDATDTVCAVIKNGVALGVKIATLGGYSFRSTSDAADLDV